MAGSLPPVPLSLFIFQKVNFFGSGKIKAADLPCAFWQEWPTNLFCGSKPGPQQPLYSKELGFLLTKPTSNVMRSIQIPLTHWRNHILQSLEYTKFLLGREIMWQVATCSLLSTREQSLSPDPHAMVPGTGMQEIRTQQNDITAVLLLNTPSAGRFLLTQVHHQT